MSSFLLVLILLAKIFVIGGTLFFIVICIIDAILSLILKFLVHKMNFLLMPCCILSYLFYSYIYFRFGAFYSSFFKVYTFFGWTKWAIGLLCFSALVGWVRGALNSATQTINELAPGINIPEEIMASYSEGYFAERDEKLLQLAITVSGLKTAPFALISFFIFIFAPDWIAVLFGNWPHWLAALFT